MNQFFLFQDNTQKGPFTISQLQSMWRNGAITGDVLYWQEGFSEWIPLSSMLDELEPSASTVSLPDYNSLQPQLAPFQAPVSMRSSKHTRVTVQQTSKTIKLFQLIFGIGFWLSLIGCFMLSDGAQAIAVFSTLICSLPIF